MEENENRRGKKMILQLYNKVLPALAERINQNLAAVVPLFLNYSLERQADTWSKNPGADAATEISLENGNVQQIGLRLRLEGFHRAGTETFDVMKELIFRLEYDHYQVGPAKDVTWLERPYDQEWTKPEYEETANRWSEELVEEITQKLERFT